MFADNDVCTDEGAGHLTSAEERLVGAMSWSMMWCYIKSCSICLAVLVVILQVARCAASVSTDFWLSEWTSAARAIGTSNNTQVSIRPVNNDLWKACPENNYFDAQKLSKKVNQHVY